VTEERGRPVAQEYKRRPPNDGQLTVRSICLLTLRHKNTYKNCRCATGINAYNNVVVVVDDDNDKNNNSHYSGNLSRYLKTGIKQVTSNHKSQIINKVIYYYYYYYLIITDFLNRANYQEQSQV